MASQDSDSVVLSIRIPKELRRRVKAQAAALDMTVQEVIISLLQSWLTQTEPPQGSPARPDQG